MTKRRSSTTRKDLLAAVVLRGISLGGRFVFIIFATKYMLPPDFGRFGLLAGLALIIPVVVGLEAYQVLLRRILQEPERANATRRFYGTFIVEGSLVTGAIGAVVLASFGWSATEIGLGALVLTLEHIGMEVNRNLINERLPALSQLSAALRTGAWGLAVPALFFFGLIQAPWTFETVLYVWIVGAGAAVLAGWPIWNLFRPQRSDFNPRRGWGLLTEVASRSRTWIVFTICLRTIETGGRFICAGMISEAAAGRFTFLSMLASLSYVAQKGVVEVIYYPRVTAVDVTADTYREYRRVSWAAVVVATLCAMLGMAASAWMNGLVPPTSELVSFGLLCLAFACLSIAQLAHYRLYRWHRDRAIMASGIAGCVAMVLSSILATRLWGIAGAAAGVLAGALVLLVVKVRAVRRLARGEEAN